MPEDNKKEMLFDGCLVEVGTRYLLIGDDMHMNGMDAPATIRTQTEAIKLVGWLREHMTRLPLTRTR